MIGAKEGSHVLLHDAIRAGFAFTKKNKEKRSHDKLQPLRPTEAGVLETYSWSWSMNVIYIYI
jgi:hypothetical protein